MKQRAEVVHRRHRRPGFTSIAVVIPSRLPRPLKHLAGPENPGTCFRLRKPASLLRF